MSDLTRHSETGLDYILVGDAAAPKRIIVILHGTGGDCENMKSKIAEPLAVLENTLFVIPNGPLSLASEISDEQVEAIRAAQVASGGDPTFDRNKAFNWTGEASFTPEEGDAEGMLRALDEIITPIVGRINKLIDDKLAEYGLSDGQLAFYGFSAGGMVALHAAMERSKPCAAIISHSGHFLGARRCLSVPPVLMMYGDQEWQDSEIQGIFSQSIDLLRGLGLSVEQHACGNLGHGVNAESLDMAGLFLRRSFAMLKNSVPAALPSSIIS